MKRIYAASALALTAALLGGIGLSILWGRANQDPDIFAQCRTTQVAGGTDSIGGPFELVSETGETVTDADIITAPTLIYFGYTFCPDVCPLDNARNAIAVEILEEQGRMVTPVFISIDPERDTPEVLQAFAVTQGGGGGVSGPWRTRHARHGLAAEALRADARQHSGGGRAQPGQEHHRRGASQR